MHPHPGPRGEIALDRIVHKYRACVRDEEEAWLTAARRTRGRRRREMLVWGGAPTGGYRDERATAPETKIENQRRTLEEENKSKNQRRGLSKRSRPSHGAKVVEKETAAAGSPRESGPRTARLRAKAIEGKTSGGGAIRDENRKKNREPRNLAPSADQTKTETQHDEKNAHGGACETESNSGSLSGEET
jgi:hypothetical protein